MIKAARQCAPVDAKNCAAKLEKQWYEQVHIAAGYQNIRFQGAI